MDGTGEESHPQSSQSPLNTITYLDLLDTWRTKYPTSRQYTWVRVDYNRVSAARLDRLYISQNLSSRLIYSSITPVDFTDHHLVTIDLVSLPGDRVKSYCFCNNKLQQNITFCQTF